MFDKVKKGILLFKNIQSRLYLLSLMEIYKKLIDIRNQDENDPVIKCVDWSDSLDKIQRLFEEDNKS